MSLEERIQKSVEAALAGLRSRVEDDVRSMVQQLVSAAEQERAEAVTAAEQHARADVEQLVESARAHEREQVEEEARRLADANVAQQVEAARASARDEMQAALASAENRAEQAVRDSVAAAHVGEREAEMAGITRLLDSVRGLDGASTLSEVLDALGLAAGREASRAAVFVLRADRLHGWKLSGFGSRDAQPKALEMTLTESGVLGLAVASARPVTTRDAQTTSEGPPFASLPPDRMGLAVPVIVGGRVVAVVYGDSVTEEGRENLVPSGWPEVIEILARHAARCLEALTVQKSAATAPSPRFWVPPGGKTVPQQTDTAPQAHPEARPQPEPPAKSESQSLSREAQDSPTGPTNEAKMSRLGDSEARSGPEEAARRFARLLLSEIRLYHEPAIDEGRRSRNLLSRLGPEIERARHLYDLRVPASLQARAELFHQELVAILAGGDAALLGWQA